MAGGKLKLKGSKPGKVSKKKKKASNDDLALALADKGTEVRIKAAIAAPTSSRLL